MGGGLGLGGGGVLRRGGGTGTGTGRVVRRCVEMGLKWRSFDNNPRLWLYVFAVGERLTTARGNQAHVHIDWRFILCPELRRLLTQWP